MGTKLRAAEDALAKYKAENKIVVNPLGKKDFTLEEMTAKHARLAERIPQLVKELSELREKSRLDLNELRKAKDAEIKRVNDQLITVKKDLEECRHRPIPVPVPVPGPVIKKDLQAEILKGAHEALEKKYNKLFSEKQDLDAKLIKLTAEFSVHTAKENSMFSAV
jgi:DNA repair exonuclease SbcCD ATPase subunit